jgi:hypothetical protein
MYVPWVFGLKFTFFAKKTDVLLIFFAYYGIQGLGLFSPVR